MEHRSLNDLLQSVENPVQMLRNSQIGAYVYPVVPRSSATGARSSRRGVKAPSCSTSRTTWRKSRSRDRMP
jgi:hypothetical protein